MRSERYISEKSFGKKLAKESVKILLQVFKPATVTNNHIYLKKNN